MRSSTPKGVRRRLSPARTFVSDLVRYGKRIPSIPVSKQMQLGPVRAARAALESRPAWTAIFMKAYARVCMRWPILRQAYIPLPYPHLYEHPETICGIAIERELAGELILVGTLVRGPEHKSLVEIDQYLRYCKEAPVDSIGYFRMALRVGRLPRPIRSVLWWTTLYISGYKKAKRLGTFGLTSYGRLGAEQIHPISPLTTVLTFGPIDPDGQVVVKLVYDHRVMDGSNVARCLAELEQVLNGEIVEELEQLAASQTSAA